SGLGASGVSASPTSLTFAGTAVGSTSASLTATLKNGLGTSITISGVAITGVNAADFAISANTCAGSLAAGASCASIVAFKPTAAGTRTATLTFTDTATNSPQTVALAGTGASAAGNTTVSPTSVSWSTVAIGSKGGQKVVTLTNGNASPITISSLTFAGVNPG